MNKRRARGVLSKVNPNEHAQMINFNQEEYFNFYGKKYDSKIYARELEIARQNISLERQKRNRVFFEPVEFRQVFEPFENEFTRKLNEDNCKVLKTKLVSPIYEYRFYQTKPGREDFCFEHYDHEYRNKSFKLVALCASVLKTDELVCCLPEQINLFTLHFTQLLENHYEIEDLIRDFEKEIQENSQELTPVPVQTKRRLKGNPQRPRNQFSELPKKYKIRIGRQLKSVFQGFDAVRVFRVLHLILAFQLNVLLVVVEKLHVRILRQKPEPGSTVFWHLFNTLEGLLGPGALDQALDDFMFNLKELGVTGPNPCFDELERLYSRELSAIFQQEVSFERRPDGSVPTLQEELSQENSQAWKVRNSLCFHPDFRSEQAIWMWVISNLSGEEYVPLAYTVSHLTSSFLDLYTFSLGMDLLPPDCSVLKVQNHSKRQKFCEQRFDLRCMLVELGLLDFSTLDQLMGLISSFPAQSSSTAGKSLTVEQQHAADMLLLRFVNFELDYRTHVSLAGLLNSEKSLERIKKIDQSELFIHFTEANNVLKDELLELKRKSPKLGDYEYIFLGNEGGKGVAPVFKVNSMVGEELIPFKEVNTLTLLIRYLGSNGRVASELLDKLEGERQILKNVVCFENLREKERELRDKINGILEKFGKEGHNDLPFEALRYSWKEEHKRFELPNEVKEKYKRGRRFNCEHILKPYLVEFYRDFYQRFFRNCHWKVVNGMMAWWYFFVSSCSRKVIETIIKLFNDVGINRIRQKTVAIKVFGAISELFKMANEARHLQGFEAEFADSYLSLIPSGLFVDIDSIFGYCETHRDDNPVWDREFLDHLEKWLTKDSRERLFGVSLETDFALLFDSVVSDLKKTHEIYGEVEFLTYLEDEPLAEEQLNSKARQREDLQLGASEDYRVLKGRRQTCSANFAQYKHFEEVSKNFFNLSASGSAFKSRLKMRPTKEVTELKTKRPEVYDKIVSSYHSEERFANHETSVSKTIMFAYTGERLPKSFYWVYSPEERNTELLGYEPKFSLNVKREPKKLRHIINADLVSFVKQTYVHDWLIETLSDVTRQKVNSLLTSTERLSLLYKMQLSFFGEKWCTPIDMKDFHFHFGPTHFRAFADVLSERARKVIGTAGIQEDMLHILKYLRSELSRGLVEFQHTTSEANIFVQSKIDRLNRNRASVAKEMRFKTLTKTIGMITFAPSVFEDVTGMANCLEGLTPEEIKDTEFRYRIKMRVSNGLMSGWKMTSLFGSLFNLVLNKICEQMSLCHSFDLLRDLNVLGDDTHFKQRFLVSSVNHVSFVNLINKQAHPDKQEISTVCTEFLKKKVNTITRQTKYSQNRILNSLLYYKDYESPDIEKNLVKDTVDIINLFLVRANEVPDIKNKLSLSILKEFLISFARDSKKNWRYSEVDIQRFLNAPSFYSGFIGGPLRNLLLNFNAFREDITDKLMDYSVETSPKVLEIDLDPEDCKGIETNALKIKECFRFIPQIELDHIFPRLILVEKEEILKGNKKTFDIGEGVCSRFLKLIDFSAMPESRSGPKADLVPINSSNPCQDQPLPEEQQRSIEIIGAGDPLFNIIEFRDYAIENTRRITEFNSLPTMVSGQLIYHNESVSRVILGILETYLGGQSYEVSRKIFHTFKELNRKSAVSEGLFHKLATRFGSNSFFKMALSQKYAISSSRVFYHDELIGFINENFSAFLIFYLLDNNFITCKDKEFIIVLKDIIVTIDYYLHQNSTEIEEAIKKIFVEKIKKSNALNLPI